MPLCIRCRSSRSICNPWHSSTASKPETYCRLFSLSSTRREISKDLRGSLAYTRKDTPNPIAKKIAVLGGGITGLATAFHLLRQLPAAHVTLYESSKRLGGWIQSEKIDVDGGHVIFENGPRTLRNEEWAAQVTKVLVALLGLEDEVVHISKNSAAARNRYIYYPDHLVRLPGMLPGASTLMNVSRNALTLWREPLFKNLFRGLLSNMLYPRDGMRPATLQDESVGSFVSRNFNRELADNLLSAVAHGIYAGDIYQLSARALFPLLWGLEIDNDGAGITRNLLRLYSDARGVPVPYEDVRLHQTSSAEQTAEERARRSAAYEGTAIFTFKEGLDTLTKGLERAVRESPRVTIKTGQRVESVSRNAADGSLRVRLAQDSAQTKRERRERPEDFDYIVSSISPAALRPIVDRGTEGTPAPLTPGKDAYHFLNETPAVNVMVVNLYYSEPDLIPVQGFGYLIPRSVPLEQNPERALGVIFGSDSSVGQDTAPGTKLTVMLGGHWWDGFKSGEFPDKQSAVEMAQNVLRRHLGISAKPVVAKAVFQQDAIPQYTVGHHQRMSKVHELLLSEYRGRLKVAGNWYQGIGVNACVNAARRSVKDIREGHDQSTGLEGFGRPIVWIMFNSRESTLAVPNASS